MWAVLQGNRKASTGKMCDWGLGEYFQGGIYIINISTVIYVHSCEELAYK